MRRLSQYLLLVGLFGVALVLSYFGFIFTGGAIPWGERFAAVMEGEVSGAGGSLFQLSRGGIGGFVLAGPLRDTVLPFVLLVLVLVGASSGLYWWASRSDDHQ